jgi:glycosyltransferase involved in cell wall biosynthesis
VTILHDINLHGFFYSGRARRGWLKRLRKPKGAGNSLHGDPYYEEMVYCYGPAGAEEVQRVLWENREPDQQNFFLNRRITRRSRGIAVHSRWAAEKVLENGDASSVFVMPHGIQINPQRDQETEKDFRRMLRGRGADISIAVAGFMNFNRRLETVYRSVKQLKERGLKPALALIGEIDPALMRHCRSLEKELDIGAQIVPTGYIKLYEVFLAHIAAVDVVVNLRYPTAGETSGVSQTAMALSKPLIVSDTPANADLPRRAAFKIRPDDLEVETLTAALEALARDADLRQAMGKAGHVHVAQTASWSLAGRMFSQYLYEVARRYNYAPSAE